MNEKRASEFWRQTENWRAFCDKTQTTMNERCQSDLGFDPGPGAFVVMFYLNGWTGEVVRYLESREPIGPLLRQLLAEIVRKQMGNNPGGDRPSALSGIERTPQVNPVAKANAELFGRIIADAKQIGLKKSELDELYADLMEATGWTKAHLQRLSREELSRRQEQKNQGGGD